MMNSVEQDDFDIQSGLQSSWALCFSVLYLVVMVAVVGLYLAAIRALALCPRAHSVTYYLVILLFFTALVEFAVIVEEFMNRFGYFLYTTTNCQLFKYTVYGNRILQVSAVLSLLYYNSLAVYLKTHRIEAMALRWFPAVVVALLLLELATTLPTALNIRASLSQQWCLPVDRSQRSLEGWLHAAILPYWLPLALALGPAAFLAAKTRARSIAEPRQSQVRVSLAVAGSYFLFHLLYYLLLGARLVEAASMDRERWNILLGMSVWFITRPMFALIALGWHLMVPTALLLLDRELCKEWPGRLIVRLPRDDSELGDSMTLEDRGPGAKLELEGATEMSPNFSVTMLENTEMSPNFSVTMLENTEISPNFSVMMLENREFHNPAFPAH